MKTATNGSRASDFGNDNLERAAYVIAGTFLAYYGIRKRSGWGIGLTLAGADLVRRGALGTGLVGAHCGPQFSGAITIDKPKEEIYSFWRELSNIPQLVPQLQSVKSTLPLTSHWIARLPGGKKYEWDAEVTRDLPNRVIEWKSLPGSRISHGGSIQFDDAVGGRGTVVRMFVQFYVPGVNALSGVAKTFGADPGMIITETLRRLKSFLEVGQVANTAGQVSGKPQESGAKREEELRVQHASENSFPASDAPAYQ
jgi:uncharacterized membrane protein